MTQDSKVLKSKIHILVLCCFVLAPTRALDGHLLKIIKKSKKVSFNRGSIDSVSVFVFFIFGWISIVVFDWIRSSEILWVVNYKGMNAVLWSRSKRSIDIINILLCFSSPTSLLLRNTRFLRIVQSPRRSLVKCIVWTHHATPFVYSLSKDCSA